MIKVEKVYPITTKRHPDGVTQEYITHDDIVAYTRPKDMPSFNNFMAGQTMFLEGYYLGDVERWLNKLPNLD